MRLGALIPVVLLAALVIVEAQGPDARLQSQLKQLFPTAASFSPRGGEPSHFKAFGAGGRAGAPPVIGYAFWTTDLQPLERGYDGPIKMLVGLDPQGKITGIVMAEHHEPYGDFSIDPPAFAAQFKGKDVRDPFRVGGDIDAVSRATITVTSATRAVRNSARRVARALLTPPETTQ
jgi:NosR/NirI family nitrous oxide reductase transcriptional regulator